MGILDNVLSKMQATPQFRPISADTFSDWSIEAGDILTVEVEGKDEVLPVFSADMDWGGAAKSTLSCSGSRERPTLSKAERQQYAAFGGISSGFSSKLKKVSDDIIEDRNELIAALNGKDGVPEDLASGIKNYVRYDLKNNEAFAGSTLFAQIGEKAKAEIRVYAVIGSDGKAHSIADIVADVIRLQGDTEVVGNLTVSDGRLRVSKGIIANGNSNIWGDLAVSGKLFVNKNNLYISGEPYVPTEITSKSGTKYTVLGA